MAHCGQHLEFVRRKTLHDVLLAVPIKRLHAKEKRALNLRVVGRISDARDRRRVVGDLRLSQIFSRVRFG